MQTNQTFGTALNCIDGRAQQAVTNWLKEQYHVDFVDMITEPGMDNVLNTAPHVIIEHIKDNAQISITAHKSCIIAIAGHHDCAGNPTSREEHWQHIHQAVDLIKSWQWSIKVIGLWLNDQWHIEEVR